MVAERTELQSAKHRLSTLAVRNEIVHEGLEVGARVEKEQPLYTIKTPDFIQAESNLIGAAPTFDLTKKELERVMACRRVSRREEVQAISDEQTADGALKAAWDAVPPVRNVCASFLESRPRRRDRALNGVSRERFRNLRRSGGGTDTACECEHIQRRAR